jgi:hypothetical protein
MGGQEERLCHHHTSFSSMVFPLFRLQVLLPGLWGLLPQLEVPLLELADTPKLILHNIIIFTLFISKRVYSLPDSQHLWFWDMLKRMLAIELRYMVQTPGKLRIGKLKLLFGRLMSWLISLIGHLGAVVFEV